MNSYLTFMKVILTLFYSQQTLVFCWCLMTEKINGTLYVGGLSSLIFCCAFVGNMTLGPLKGYIDTNINKTVKGRIIAGIIPQLIFGMLVVSVYNNNTNAIIFSIIIWHLVGMPFISAHDCLMDDCSTIILKSSSSFAIAQYIGTKIIARISFAFISDNYNIFKDIITILSLLSIIFGIVVHVFVLNYYQDNTVKEKSNTKDNANKQKNMLSILCFAPLFFVIFEAFFLDTPLSSLKFIIPRFKDIANNSVILSSTFISTSEIITSIIFTGIISYSKVLDGINFRDSWKKYSQLHFISTIVRIYLIILLVYFMNIQSVNDVDNYIIANITKKSFSGKTVVHYGISNLTNMTLVRFLVILSTIANSSIDAFSSIMIIVLLKSYSKNMDIKYSSLDGFVRFFTYIPAIVPWIKRNKMLSVYSSGGYLINTLSLSLLLYAFICYWNYYQLRKIKAD